MYYPPNQPYIPYSNRLPYYAAIQQEKHNLRHTSLVLCFTVFGVLICFQILPLFLSSFFSERGTAYYGFSPLLYQLFYCTAYLLCVAIPTFIFFGTKRGSISDAMPFAHTSAFVAVPAAIAGFGLCLLANIPAGWIANIETAAGFDISTPDPYIKGNVAAQVFYFISVAIIPPFVEETLFRGAVLHSLRRFGDGFAILGSSLLFGLFHGDFAQFVFAFFCGMIMAFVVIKTNCLWISIAIHFLNNALASGMDLVTYYYGAEMESLVYRISFVSVLVLALLCVIILGLRNKNFFRIKPQNSILKLSQKFGALIVNFGGIVLVLFSIMEAIYRLRV